MNTQTIAEAHRASPSVTKGSGVDWTKVSEELSLTKNVWDSMGRFEPVFRGGSTCHVTDHFNHLSRENDAIVRRVEAGEGGRVSATDQVVFGIMKLIEEKFKEFSDSQDPRVAINADEPIFKDVGVLLSAAQLVIAKAQTTIESSGQ